MPLSYRAWKIVQDSTLRNAVVRFLSARSNEERMIRGKLFKKDHKYTFLHLPRLFELEIYFDGYVKDNTPGLMFVVSGY